MNNFLNYKQWTDTYSAILSQGALTLFLGSGMYQKNRREIQKIYMQRMKKLKEVVASLDTNGEIEWISLIPVFCLHALTKGNCI